MITRSAIPGLVAALQANGVAKFAAEAGVLFGALTLFERLAMAPGAYAAMALNPYWIPVLILAVQRGVLGGVGAAAIASALHIASGLPERAMDQDIAAYRADILALPLLWLVAAITIGLLRSRQAAAARLQADALAQTTQQCNRFATAIEDLAARNTQLERRIAADLVAPDAGSSLWSFLDAPGNRTLLERATPILATAADAESLGVFERRGDRFHRVAGSGPLELSAEAQLFDHPSRQAPAAPWSLVIAPATASAASTASSDPAKPPAGDNATGDITSLADTAVIVFELRDGIDPALSHRQLSRVVDGLNAHLATLNAAIPLDPAAAPAAAETNPQTPKATIGALARVGD